MEKIPKVILAIETSHNYGRGLLRGIAKYCRLHNSKWSIFRQSPFYRKFTSRGVDSGTYEILKHLDHIKPDGIIIREPEHIEELTTLGIPIIISPVRLLPELPAIIPDSEGIGRLAAEHFIERGFKNFAYCGFHDVLVSGEYGKNFQKNVAEKGFKVFVYQPQFSNEEDSLSDEQTYITKWLLSLPKPIGILCCNDDRGRDVLEVCKINDIHVPDEVAVMGCDNDELVCELTDPPLSSISLDSERSGYQAAELLTRLMSGEKMAAQTLISYATQVVTRQSTDVLAVDDRDVAAAIRFIRQHARKPIQVVDVAEAVALSRQYLHEKFKNTLRRTILEEIKRVRTDEIIKLLLETDWSISQIASQLGFSGTEHIARYFRAQMDTSPQQFRKKFASLPTSKSSKSSSSI